MTTSVIRPTFLSSVATTCAASFKTRTTRLVSSPPRTSAKPKAAVGLRSLHGRVTNIALPRAFPDTSMESTACMVTELAGKATAAAATAAAPALVTVAAVLASQLAFPALWAVGAVPCCLAFLNPIYVFSVGYGLSVAAQAVVIWFALLSSQVWIPTTMVLHLAGTVLYGTRLGVFLYIRSVTWPEWNARAKNAPEAKASTIPQKLAIITVCSLLYASMCSPLLWHAQCANSVPGGQVPIVIAGLSAQWCGFLLETVADHQKSEYKKNVHKSNDNRWCAVGLYETCRHPNYLGEILFWVGLFIAGVPAMLCKGWWSFAPAVVGLLFIVNLMTSVSKKQDEKQKARYENDAAYEQWVARTGSLLPKLW